MVILWLVHDILVVGNNKEKNGRETIALDTHLNDPAHVRPPLTIRELKVQEEEETDKPPSSPIPHKPPSTVPSTKATTDHQPTKTHKQVPQTKDNSVEHLIENIHRSVRPQTDSEAAGNNIMITIRTTRKFHQKRLPYMYDTWLTTVNGSNVFLVTDAEDEEYQEKSKQLGENYH